MKFNLKKVATILGSALMVGATAGIAAAASYPAPFVQSGAANVAIVVGQNAALSDGLAATSISSNLATTLAAQTATGSTSTNTISGDAVSLDTSSDRVWLNTSLNAVKSSLGKTELPVVLADYTFDGDVSSKLTSTITIGSGVAAGGDNSNKVIFTKQPKSSDDPVIGISLPTASSTPLYNASVTMSAINFTDSDSQGETIKLFGRDFVVSTETDLTKLVLYKSAKEVTLTVGGANPASTKTVNIDGTDYEITLTNGDSTTAYLTVNGDSKSISEGNSRKVGGIEVAVKDVVAGSDSVGTTATILVGAQKLTFQNGQKVQVGSDLDPIDGTLAYIVGGTNATTKLAVAVYAPRSSDDAILAGTPFVDPVFGSFKVDFQGISSPLDDSGRDKISIMNSGDKAMDIEFTDSEGNTQTIPFAYNTTYASPQVHTPAYQPANWRLADDSNKSIFVYEGANLTEDEYVIVGNEDYGHLLQVTQISNNTGTDYTKDSVKFQDVMSGETYDSVFTSEGVGTVSVDGKQYIVTFVSDNYASIKYPTSESSTSSTFVVYPTIKTKNGGKMALYEPLNISISAFNGTAAGVTVLQFPDGDGYTSLTLTYAASNGGHWNYTVSGATTGTLSSGNLTSSLTFAVGKLTYNLTGQASTNRSMLYLANPEATTAGLVTPAVVLFEGKDDNNNYEAVVVDTEGNAASMGSSTNGVGINSVYTTTAYYNNSVTMESDSDFTEDIDWWGTLVTSDASDSDQKTAIISYPSAQVFSNIFVGEVAATVSSSSSSGSATELGSATITDAEASSATGKNLIVIGGSCINSVAADLLGGAKCGADFTAATGINAGEALIKSFDRSGNVALLVAGYNAEDTAKAATYLVNKGANTSVGSALKVTSATEATAITA